MEMIGDEKTKEAPYNGTLYIKKGNSEIFMYTENSVQNLGKVSQKENFHNNKTVYRLLQ